VKSLPWPVTVVVVSLAVVSVLGLLVGPGAGLLMYAVKLRAGSAP
jgi:hypothetical protein